MRFFSLVAPVLSAFAALAAAYDNQINYPTSGVTLQAGQPLEIKWTPTTPGTVTLKLRSGNSQYLDKGSVIASSIPNSGSYTFQIPSSTPYSAYYTIEIIADSVSVHPNYSPQFVINSNAMSSSSSSYTVTPTHKNHPAKTHKPKTKLNHVKLGSSSTSAQAAGVTKIPPGGGAAGLDVSRGMAAMLAVGAGVAVVL